MRQKPALDLVFKKTPKSFSVKPAHQEDEVKFSYESYEILSEVAFDKLINPQAIIKTQVL